MIPDGYRGYADVFAQLHALPNLRFRVLGTSVDNIPIVGCELGPERASTTSVVIAGLHALEWIGVETALALAHRLSAEPPADRRIVMVAIANPDGYRLVEGDLLAGRRKFRRKNLHGVDLNRNWPAEFRRGRKAHGPAPCSEPEIAAIVRALDDEVAAGSRIEVAVSLHSFGRKLLLPWGARWKRPPRWHELDSSARAIQARITDRYTISQCARWVPGWVSYGMEIDDLHIRYGANALLVECSRGGLSFDPQTWLAPFRWFNPPDPARVAHDLARALEPFVRGH